MAKHIVTEKIGTKEMKFEIDVKPVDGEEIKQDENVAVQNEQDEGNDVDQLLVQMQDMMDMIIDLKDRMAQIEGQPDEPIDEPVEEPVEEPENIEEQNESEDDAEKKDDENKEEACGEKEEEKTEKKEELSGIPERDENEGTSTSGDNAIKKQTDTGSEINPEDAEKKAVSETPKPAKEEPKPTVQKNSIEDKTSVEKMIEAELNALKESNEQKPMQTFEEDLSKLTERQTIVSENVTKKEQKDQPVSEAISETNKVIAEYLRKSGIIHKF